jgi:hypothetical protein
MTKAADIQTLLKNRVFDNAALKSDFSPRYVDYALSIDSEVEIKALSFRQKLNFFQALVSPGFVLQGLGGRRLNFAIELSYIREKDARNESHQKVRDGIEVVQKLIRTEMIDTVEEAVDFYELGSGQIPITELTIANVRCWRAQFSLTAIKTVFKGD